MTRDQVLAFEIADAAARVDIECACRSQRSGPHRWFDLSTCEREDSYAVSRAVAYIEVRGEALGVYRMVRSQALRCLVRFEERQ